MEYPQFCRFSAKLDAYLAPFSRRPSSKTIEQYVAACRRMKTSNRDLSAIGRAKRSYYVYRAALIFCAHERIRYLHRMAQFAYDHGQPADGYRLVLAISKLLGTLKRYPPDPNHKRKDSQEVGEWEKSARVNKIGKKSHSKRHMLARLPQDWRSQMWGGVSEKGKYRAAIAVLACIGARPSEIQQGVSIEHGNGGCLRFTILGTKTHEGKYGQAVRKITINIDSPEAEFLADKLSALGSTMIVDCKPALLKDAVVNVSKKVFPDAKEHVSPYTYRHQFSADMKDAGTPEEMVAQGMGHSVVETQRYYGQRRQGRSGGNRVLAVKTTRAIRPRRRVYRGPASNGPKRGAP